MIKKLINTNYLPELCVAMMGIVIPSPEKISKHKNLVRDEVIIVYVMYMWACTFCIVMWLWWALSCGINDIHGFIKSVWDIRPKNPLVRTLLWNFRNNLELVQLYLAKPNMLNYTCLIVPEILETGVPQGTILDPLLSMTFWNLFMLSD